MERRIQKAKRTGNIFRPLNKILLPIFYVENSGYQVAMIFRILRGRGEGGNGGKKGKGCHGTYVRYPWTKPKGHRIKGGRWGLLGWGEVVAGKWR